jgi:hypothetical protein
VLSTLAAAYAEAGRFSEAAETAQQAFDLARRQHNPQLAEALRRRVPLFNARTPYRQPPP